MGVCCSHRGTKERAELVADERSTGVVDQDVSRHRIKIKLPATAKGGEAMVVKFRNGRTVEFVVPENAMPNQTIAISWESAVDAGREASLGPGSLECQFPSGSSPESQFPKHTGNMIKFPCTINDIEAVRARSLGCVAPTSRVLCPCRSEEGSLKRWPRRTKPCLNHRNNFSLTTVTFIGILSLGRGYPLRQ